MLGSCIASKLAHARHACTLRARYHVGLVHARASSRMPDTPAHCVCCAARPRSNMFARRPAIIFVFCRRTVMFVRKARAPPVAVGRAPAMRKVLGANSALSGVAAHRGVAAHCGVAAQSGVAAHFLDVLLAFFCAGSSPAVPVRLAAALALCLGLDSAPASAASMASPL